MIEPTPTPAPPEPPHRAGRWGTELFPGARYFTKGHGPERQAVLTAVFIGRVPKGRRDRVFVSFESPVGSGDVREQPADDFLERWMFDRHSRNREDPSTVLKELEKALNLADGYAEDGAMHTAYDRMRAAIVKAVADLGRNGR